MVYRAPRAYHAKGLSRAEYDEWWDTVWAVVEKHSLEMSPDIHIEKGKSVIVTRHTPDEHWLCNYLIHGSGAVDARKGHWSRWLQPPPKPRYDIRLAELRRLLNWPTWIVRTHIESSQVYPIPQGSTFATPTGRTFYRHGSLIHGFSGLEWGVE